MTPEWAQNSEITQTGNANTAGTQRRSRLEIIGKFKYFKYLIIMMKMIKPIDSKQSKLLASDRASYSQVNLKEFDW